MKSIFAGTIACAFLGACAVHTTDMESKTATEAIAVQHVTEAAPAPPGGTVGTNTVTATAKVTNINQKTREVTLQRPDGTSFTFHAGEQVRNLKQVKKGDQVTVTYYESLAYQIQKPGEASPGAGMAEDVRRAQPGEKPGGSIARAHTMTATIKAIDKLAGTVTLVGPDGKSETIKARDPRNLDLIGVGDLVDLTYTEAMAIQVKTPTAVSDTGVSDTVKAPRIPAPPPPRGTKK